MTEQPSPPPPKWGPIMSIVIIFWFLALITYVVVRLLS